MGERIRRTASPWDTVPKDGTPFHALNIFRFNPLAKQWEVLARDDEGERRWFRASFGECEPTVWMRLLPLPYEVPNSFAFTVTCRVRRKSLFERLTQRWFAALALTPLSSFRGALRAD